MTGDDITQSHRYLRAALDTFDELFFIFDGAAQLRDWNQAVEAITGYDEETLRGMSVEAFIAEPDVDRVRDAIVELLDTGAADVEAELHTADGDRIPYEFRANRLALPDTADPGFVGVGYDITERQKRERELTRYRKIIDALVDGSPNYLFVHDATGTYLEARIGRRWGTMEHTAEELIGRTVHDVLPAKVAERVHDAIRRTLDSGTPQTIEYKIDRQARTGWYEANIVPLPDGYEGGEAVVLAAHEVTERKEQTRALAQQNERLESFASILSHDLRNPLNVAQGRIELARQESDSEHLADAADAVDRSLALIDDLLTLAREGQDIGETESVDLAELITGCWQTVETGEASLVIETDQTVLADASRLQQLLENLMQNAVEHGGSAVTVTIGDLDDDTGFYVADDGPGIPAEERKDVFEAGYSRNPGGTGFGLNIVQEIAEGHGWQVRVTESDTGGARFEITGVEHAD